MYRSPRISHAHLAILGATLLIAASAMWSQPEEVSTAAALTDGSYVFSPEEEAHVETIGEVLFTRYIYPFEIMAIMLLAGIIGAVLLTKKKV